MRMSGLLEKNSYSFYFLLWIQVSINRLNVIFPWPVPFPRRFSPQHRASCPQWRPACLHPPPAWPPRCPCPPSPTRRFARHRWGETLRRRDSNHSITFLHDMNMTSSTDYTLTLCWFVTCITRAVMTVVTVKTNFSLTKFTWTASYVRKNNSEIIWKTRMADNFINESDEPI